MRRNVQLIVWSVALMQCISLPLKSCPHRHPFSSVSSTTLLRHSSPIYTGDNIQRWRGGWSPSDREQGIVETTVRSTTDSVRRTGIAAMAWWRRNYKASIRKSNAVRRTSGSKSPSNNRLEKELSNFLSEPPCNCTVSVGGSIRDWTVQFVGSAGSVFEGETYKLKMIFPIDYPSKPPRVYFLKPTPKHQHVYSNGDICLNLLGTDWRPNLRAETLVVSIISMLASAKEKKIPVDNALHSGTQPGAGEQLNWMYHDDNC